MGRGELHGRWRKSRDRGYADGKADRHGRESKRESYQDTDEHVEGTKREKSREDAAVKHEIYCKEHFKEVGPTDVTASTIAIDNVEEEEEEGEGERAERRRKSSDHKVELGCGSELVFLVTLYFYTYFTKFYTCPSMLCVSLAFL